MKKILQRLFIPNPSTAILISIPLYVLVGAVLAKEITGPVAYFAYFLYSFTAALVSMLSLEIAMTARFGAEDISFRKQMTALTGLGVCSIVLIMAVSMIIKSSTWFKQNHN